MHQVVQIARKVSAQWLALALLILATGCGGASSGPTRYSLSGTVTYGGAPVTYAEMFFTPNDEQGNEGPSGIAIAKDGKYELGAGKGIVGGAYKVRITSQSPVPLKEGESFTPQFPVQEFQVDLPKEGGTHNFDISTTGENAVPSPNSRPMPL